MRGGFCRAPKFIAFRHVTDTACLADTESIVPLKAESRGRKLPFRHIVSGATLLIAIAALVLALHKPQPVAQPLPRQAVAAYADSFQKKADQLAAPSGPASDQEVHLTTSEITAAIAQSAGGVLPTPSERASTADGNNIADLALGDGSPNIGEPVVSFEGDLVKGQFATELGGKKVYVTVSGHLGSKDGYATFDPTEFKVGDLNVPVSLVSGALQKKMQEQRDKLKLPDYVSDIKVENGELVVSKK